MTPNGFLTGPGSAGGGIPDNWLGGRFGWDPAFELGLEGQCQGSRTGSLRHGMMLRG